MSDSKRMHPLGILLRMGKVLKDAIIPLVIGFFALIRDLSAAHWWVPFAGIGGVLLLSGLFALIWWLRFTYRLEEDELRIEYGIIVKHKRYISKYRIQSVNVTANILHRMLSLVKIEVQTAGGGQHAEANIPALSKADADAIAQFVKQAKQAEQQEDPETESAETAQTSQAIRKLSFRRLLITAATSGGTGLLVGLFTVVFQQVGQVTDYAFFPSIYRWFIAQSVILAAIVVLGSLIMLGLTAMLGTILKYCFFSISKQDNELFIERGLLEKRQITLPLHRIQAVKVEENLLRLPFGLVAVNAEVVGGATDSKNEGFSTILFPLLRKREAAAFIAAFVPDYQADAEWKRPPKRSLLRYLFFQTLIAVVVTIPIIYFLHEWGLFALLLVAAAIVFGYWSYKDAGVDINKELLLLQFRGLTRTTVYIKRKKIQAFTGSSHYFQTRRQLKTIKTAVASESKIGKQFKVRHLAEEDVHRIAGWYSFRK